MSTSSWLASSQHGEMVFVATVEGTKYALTSASGTVLTALQTAYQADGYADVLAGLDVVGEYAQSIQPFEPIATGSTVALRFVDLAGTLSAYLFAPRSANRTYLEARLDANDTTASATTSGFAASGDIYIGRECVQYAALDADSFNTLTRGTYSDGRTSSSARLGSDHDYITTGDVTGPQLSPAVSSLPVVLPGRIVSIYAHQVERDVPCSIANRACLFRGYLDEVTRTSDGVIQLRVAHLQRVLDTQILRSQFVGTPSTTITISDPQLVRVAYDNGVDSYQGETTVADGAYEDWRGLLGALSAALSTLSGTVSGHKWSAHTISIDGETRCRVAFSSSSFAPESTFLTVRLGPMLAGKLGFRETTSAEYHAPLWLVDETSGTFAVNAAWRPVLWASTSYARIPINRTAGRWVSQNTARLPLGCPSYVNGFLAVGDTIWQAQYVSESSDVYQFNLDLALTDTGWGGSDDRKQLYQGREGDELPELKQVWIERAGLGDWLLRTLLSTGVTNHNATTYDDRAASMGAGFPYSFLDAASFVGGQDPLVLVQVTAPTSIAKIVEPLLAAAGRYLVLDGGVLRLITLPWDSALGSYQALTPADYYGTGSDAYPEMAWGRDGVINRVKLKTGLAGLMDETEITVNNVASMGDFGPQPGPTLEAPGLINLRAWGEEIAEPVVRYFARGPQRLGLSVGWTCSQLVPGDRVSITDPSLLDPATGSVSVTNLYAIVVSASFDCASGSGRVEVLYLADTAAKGGYWTPCARVSTYTSGDPSVTVAEHTYSDSTESADDADFGVGDVVTIHSIDSSGALQTWIRTLTGVDHVTRKLSFAGALTGCDPSTRVYDVTYAAITSSIEAQYTDHAYHADATGTSTGGTVTTPYQWYARQDAIIRSAPSSVGLPTLPTIAQGGACAVNQYAIAAGVIDRLAQYRSQSVIASASFPTAFVGSVTDPKTEHLYWAALPVWLPAYHESWGGVTVVAACACSAVAEWKVTPVLCRALPTGSDGDAGYYSLGPCIKGAELNFASTSYVAESGAVGAPYQLTGLWYLVLLAVCQSGSGTLSLRDLTVYGA